MDGIASHIQSLEFTRIRHRLIYEHNGVGPDPAGPFLEFRLGMIDRGLRAARKLVSRDVDANILPTQRHLDSVQALLAKGTEVNAIEISPG